VLTQEKSKRSEGFRAVLSEIKELKINNDSYPLPHVFRYPHDTRILAANFDIGSCKVMSSKKAPLWIQTLGHDPNSIPNLSIFKLGDDLRQDMLILQIMRVIDNWWLAEGMDLKMKPYRVISIKDQIGYLEVVKHSDTVESIHKKFGGSAGAFDKNTIKKYLEANNKDAG
jgi:phosphatidylinositol kinase/protein kinase (PI-3  family)